MSTYRFPGSFLLITVILFVSIQISQASAEPVGGVPQLLSYGDLMRLSPAKREAYLKGLRGILLEMARVSSSEQLPSVAERNQKIRDTLVSLLRLFPEAAAAETSLAELSELSEIAPKFGDPDQSSAPTCDESRGIIARPVSGKAWGCFMDRESSDNCSPGFVAVNQDPKTGKFMCQTAASFWMLPKDAKAQARKTSSTNTQLNKLFEQANVQSPCPDATAFRAVPTDRDSDVSVPFVCVNPSTTSAKCAPGFVGVLQEKDGKFLCASKSSVNRLTPRQRSMAMAENPAVSEDIAANFRDSDGDVPGSASEKQNISGSVASAGKCAPVELSCEVPRTKKERVDARKKFLASGASQKCVYAGNINRYQRSAKGSLCESKHVWEVVANSSRVPAQENKYFWKCDAPQVICNPLVFGIQKEGRKPFCVSSRSQKDGDRSYGPTEACDRISTPELRAPDFLDLKEPSGMHDMWVQFKNDFDSLCVQSKESLNFHCAECKIIAKRLPEVNYQAVGNCEGAKGGSVPPQGPASKAGPGKI